MTQENAVLLKLPTFWTSQPELWFAQAKAQFALRGITVDEIKYYYVITAFNQPTATQLLDSNPPTDHKYGVLKTRLTDTFGLTTQERASRLLHFYSLGDSKPSTLMDEMPAFLGVHPPCLLFNQLFLECFPVDIRIQLVDAKIEHHRALAKCADALWE